MKKSVVKPREYKYSDLKSVKANTTVDVYGVVRFLKNPFKTRGRDYCMVVSLMDQSCGTEDKLKCLLFNSDPEKLPNLHIGDIVRFHRLKVGMFNDEEQGQSGPGFSWLIFSKEKDSPVEPTECMSPNYTFTDSDKKKIEDLRDWIAEKDELSEQNKTAPLEVIIPQMYFDLVCQVVATCCFEDDHCFVLRVWDGTVSTYELRKFEFLEELVPNYDQDLMKKSDGFQVDVALYDDHCDKARDKIKPGDFIKLVNLHAAIFKTKDTRPSDIPTLELVLHRGNSFGRGFVLATNKTLQEHLETVSSHVKIDKKDKLKETKSPNTKEKDETEKNKKTKDNQTEKESPSKSINNENAIFHDSQQPSTSNYNSKKASKRKNPFEDLINKPGDKNSNVVTSTSVEEKKSVDNVIDSVDNVIDDAQQVNINMTKESMSQSSGSRCMQQTLTVVLGHPHVKITKIEDVLTTNIPYKFRILGCVDSIIPLTDNIYDFIKLYCERCNYLSLVPNNGKTYECLILQRLDKNGIGYYFCPKCYKNKDLQNGTRTSESVLKYVFSLRMTISDGTGTLMALLWGQEAVRFFKDLDPVDALCSKGLWHEVKEELDDLCSSDKPLMECCIMSYTVKQKTLYQIFDTSVV